MGAFISFLNSEKGLLALTLIAGATVLAALGAMTIEQWLDYSKWIFGFYVGGKTLQGGASAIASALKPATTTTVVTPDKAVQTSEAAKEPTTHA